MAKKKTTSKKADALRKKGFAAGEEWARDTASKQQLKRLAAYVEEEGAVHLAAAYHAGNQTGPAERLFDAINGTEGDYGDQGAAFWEGAVGEAEAKLIGEDEEYSDYANGFVEGALSVWKIVERFVTTTRNHP